MGKKGWMDEIWWSLMVPMFIHTPTWQLLHVCGTTLIGGWPSRGGIDPIGETEGSDSHGDIVATMGGTCWIVFCEWNYPASEDLVINPMLFSIDARHGSEFPFSIWCVPIDFSSQWRVATILSHSQAHKGLIIDAGQQAEWSQSGFISDLVETVYLLMLMEEWSLYWPFFFYLLTTLLSEMCAKCLSWTYFKGNFAGN
jgi:hypothetical protein